MDTEAAAPSLLLALGLGFAALTAIALLAAHPHLVWGDDARPDAGEPLCEPPSVPTPASTPEAEAACQAAPTG